METDKSHSLFLRAIDVIPGGVNSPVRAFKQVGGEPVFMKSAKGAFLFDEDGNQYIDFINSWGAMILGHAHDDVVNAITEKVQKGTSFGTPTELEVKLAELIISMVPGAEMVRMVSSGTEACMTAIRLARGVTGRNKIVKFEGCYHGHSDALLAKAGSGVATLGIQEVPGIPSGALADTITIPFNDIETVEKKFQNSPTDIAAVIVEPVAGNMGCIPPSHDFLQSLHRLCKEKGSLLIFDEVMTGFRLAKGGAQELFNVNADIVTYGKIIGGGMPVGAIAGRREIMNSLAPVGKIYQAGTLSGNPLAMTSGYATLSILKNNPHYYSHLNSTTLSLANGLRDRGEKYQVPLVVNQVGSMISLHFSDKEVTNFKGASESDLDLFKQYFHFMLQNGVYLPPSPFESWFVSIAITKSEVDKVLSLTDDFLKKL